MNEWSVVGVIIALIGLVAAIAKPLIALNKTMTELSCSVKNLIDRIDRLEGSNKEGHNNLWKHNIEQDNILKDHEGRIIKLEGREAL